MQFRVPKFLEREAKIAFGLTFKKLGVMGGMALLVFILWYVIPHTLVVLIAIVLVAAFVVGAFVKIGGQSIPDLVKYSFSFFLSSRTYMWGRKAEAAPIKFVKKKREAETEERSPLRIAPESRLGSMSSKIELGIKSSQE